MMRTKHFIISFFTVVLASFFAVKMQAQNQVVDFKRIPFSPWDVRLSDSPFQKAMELDKMWILNINVDKLLSGYRTEAGLEPKAAKYGGWESGGLSGHSLGHYLSALSLMYASTDDARLNDRIKYILDELDVCQQKSGGMLAGFPRAKELFSELRDGDIRSQGFDLNGYWVPIYNIHKLFAGLVDTYHYTKNEEALKLLSTFSSWWISVLSNLDDQQLQKILLCESGGINEAMADVSFLTGDKKFLDYAERLNHQALIRPLQCKKDSLCGQHANTQIPKILGVMRQYELTGKKEYKEIADFFWSTVVNHHTYVIGGNSESEHFGRPDNLYNSLSAMTAENCNTYNMLKLTKHLYMLDASPDKPEYSERALFNQILGSQHPKTGMVRYFSPVVGGHSTKGFSDPENSFWCCVGSGWENHARYGEQIYFKDFNENLYVNLYIPSTLKWDSRKTEIKQTSDLLHSGNVHIVVNTAKKQRFSLFLRIPQWAKEYQISINGKQIAAKVADGYIKINREWTNMDSIDLHFKMSVYSEPILGQPSMRAFLYGPFVLNAVVPSDTLINALVTDDGDFEGLVKRDNAGQFSIKVASGEELLMKPYYKSPEDVGFLYFNCFTTEEWKQSEKTLRVNKMNQEELKKRTIDFIQLGEMQPERDHDLQGSNTDVGVLNEQKYRRAVDGGYFSFRMKVSSNDPMTLICSYWGNMPHGHTFDIRVDGTLLTTAIIHNKGHLFFDEKYNIPVNLTMGKDSTVISFHPVQKDFIAGPIFQCTMIINK